MKLWRNVEERRCGSNVNRGHIDIWTTAGMNLPAVNFDAEATRWARGSIERSFDNFIDRMSYESRGLIGWRRQSLGLINITYEVE
jgi:hypothetical protein